MNPVQSVGTTGCQRGLTEFWENQTQPTPTPQMTQRQKKRQSKDTDTTSKKTKKHLVTRRIQITNNTLSLEPSTPSGAASPKTESWGDPIDSKWDGYIRLASRNIGGLGIHANNIKEEYLKEWIVNSEIDCIGIQELNLNLRQCTYRDRIQERMKSSAWEFFKMASGYNKHHEGRQKHLFGGTMVLAYGQFCHRVLSSGADERGLGRWAWLHIKGTKNASTRIISAYRPCKTRSVLHNSTVYRQQVKRLKELDLDICPLDQYTIDLIALLRKRIAAGDKIVLMIDSNEDVRNGSFNAE